MKSRISRRTRPLSAAVAALVAGVLLGGCGGDQTATDDAGEPSSSPPAAADPTPTPAPSEELPEDPPTGPPGKGGSTQISGTVTVGVEDGCYLLTSGGTTYQLIWEQAELATGQQVEVTGTVERDLMTTCQQGTPFVVARLQEPLDQPR